MIEMVKKSKYVTIGIKDEVYIKLFKIKNDTEREKQKRISFSGVIDILIEKSKFLDVKIDRPVHVAPVQPAVYTIRLLNTATDTAPIKSTPVSDQPHRHHQNRYPVSASNPSTRSSPIVSGFLHGCKSASSCRSRPDPSLPSIYRTLT